MVELLIIFCLVFVLGFLAMHAKNNKNEIKTLKTSLQEAENKTNEVQTKLKEVMSKKTSDNTRLGAIAENLLPLLTDLPYNPKNLHHLGQPIDFLYFDYDEEPSIVFVECKSGNARESARQKLIRNVIKEGKIHYDLVQITTDGIKVTRKI